MYHINIINILSHITKKKGQCGTEEYETRKYLEYIIKIIATKCYDC